MHKWLLFVAALLLVASLTGDVFFVHHHLGDFAAESEHTPPQYAFDFLDNLVGTLNVPNNPLFGLSSCWSDSGTEGNLSYFGGWHNSAYLEEAAFCI
jgi:hypothetical protein